MARIRSVKPDLRISRVVASWPMPARYAWVLLWGYLDDYGRGLDDVRLIVADCFPLDRDITERRMEGWLKLYATPQPETEKPAPLCRYEVRGQTYLHCTNWHEHQRVNRPTDSKHPPCPLHESLTEPLTEPSREDSRSDSLRARKEMEVVVLVDGDGVPPTADAGPPTAAQVTAATLIGAWLDDAPVRPPSRTIARVGRTLRELLEEGIRPEHAQRGLALWVERGKDPASLTSFVHEAQRPATAGQPKASTTDQRVQAGLDLAAQLRAAEGTQPQIGA